MISDRDVWAAALLIVKRYGDDAMLGGIDGCSGWEEACTLFEPSVPPCS